MADNARLYNGSGNLCTRVNPPVLTNAAWTFATWAKPTSYGGDGRGLLHVGPANAISRGIMFYFDSTGLLRLRANAGTYIEGPDTAIPTGTWSTVGVTRSGVGVASIEFALNGVSESGGAMDPPPEITTGDAFILGGGFSDFGIGTYHGEAGWSFWLQGVALTPAQQHAYLHNPASLVAAYGPAGTLSAGALRIFWPQQRNDGTTETDVSGGAVHGTYTGTTFSSGTGPSPTTPWNPYGSTGPTAYTLPAAPGALAQTGIAAATRTARRMVAAAAAVTLVGQPATLGAAGTVAAEPGAIALQGPATALRVARQPLAANPGTFTVTGPDAGRRLGYTMPAAPGVFEETPAPDGPAFALMGQDATLTYVARRALTADSRAHTLTGQSATLRLGRRVAASVGTHVLAAPTTGVRAARGLAVDAAAFAFDGVPAGLQTIGQLAAEPVLVTWTGSEARLAVGRVLPASPVAVALDGASITPRIARGLAAEPGVLTQIGLPAALRLGDVAVTPTLVLLGPVTVLTPPVVVWNATPRVHVSRWSR